MFNPAVLKAKLTANPRQFPFVDFGHAHGTAPFDESAVDSPSVAMDEVARP
jgi:hypothetical protein